jgi:hypothetical protein
MIAKPAMVRQGDVLIVPVSRPVDEADVGTTLKDTDERRVVLAHGEVTGHAHALYFDEVPVPQRTKALRLYDLRNAARYAPLTNTVEGRKVAESAKLLRLATTAFLRHEEHDGIALPKGDYVVLGQVEFDDREELRRVND